MRVQVVLGPWLLRWQAFNESFVTRYGYNIYKFSNHVWYIYRRIWVVSTIRPFRRGWQYRHKWLCTHIDVCTHFYAHIYDNNIWHITNQSGTHYEYVRSVLYNPGYRLRSYWLEISASYPRWFCRHHFQLALQFLSPHTGISFRAAIACLRRPHLILGVSPPYVDTPSGSCIFIYLFIAVL